MIWQREKILPLAEYIYCVPVEKSIVGKDDVKLDLPISGVYMEGWMNLNPEFITLNYSFEDDKNAFIWCKLGKSMEVGQDYKKKWPQPSNLKEEPQNLLGGFQSP